MDLIGMQANRQQNKQDTLSGISLRPAGAADEPFLFQLYASTRAEEMALVDWSPAQQEAFLRQQFAAQLSHYRSHFPQAQHTVICLNDEPIGRFYVNRGEEEVRVLDITLAPGHRQAGIGRRLMQDLMEEAAQAGKPVRLYVWQFNHGARRFYARLGFAPISEAGVYSLLEWRPL